MRIGIRLAFKAVSQMAEPNKQIVLSAIDGMILKHQAEAILDARKAS